MCLGAGRRLISIRMLLALRWSSTVSCFRSFSTVYVYVYVESVCICNGVFEEGKGSPVQEV